MSWLQSLDVVAFRFVNTTLQNPLFDVVMPIFSGNPFFYPGLALLGLLLLWRGGPRWRICVLLLLIILPLGDSYICNPIKHGVERLRPFIALSDVHQSIGAGHYNSMPSSHAANWAAATAITFLFFRRSWRYMVPLALLVSFSRVYNGVHYPGDILAGWALGGAYGFAAVWGLHYLWRWAGGKWFPLWWANFPSLVPTGEAMERAVTNPQPSTAEQHWLRLGYVFIGALLLVRWAYLAAGIIGLSEDEAYYWLWSKHPALSYYSKPPLIAGVHWLGTAVWGDTVFGVRFFAPLIGAVLGCLLLRFIAREVNARLGVILLLVVTATPLLAVGATLMTIDPLTVLLWTAAMLSGWRAIRDDARTRDWLWVGLWMGLGLLAKYTALFQWVCWAVVFALIPSARKQWRRPGIYLAFAVNLLCAVPLLYWNSQHGWVSFIHTAERGNLGDAWKPTLRYFLDFMGAEAFLLNPIFFGPVLWALVAGWRRRRQNVLMTYLWAMGAPVFLGYMLWTFHSRVLPNWIAPAVLPMLCVAVMYWHERWRAGGRAVARWFVAGMVVGLGLVVLLHDTKLVKKIAGRPLPAKLDGSRRVRGWPETASLVAEARQKLLAGGNPVFIIGGHYGLTSQLAFYLPEARGLASSPQPLVYCLPSPRPGSQFYFWPGYLERHGQSAIYVNRVGESAPAGPPPDVLVAQFQSVTSLGVFDVQSRRRGDVVRRIQLFECRHLK